MQLQCSTCQHPILATDINIEIGIAKCTACNNVFSFLDALGCAKIPRPIIPLPKRFRVDNWGSELTITRRWYQHAVWAMLGFCIFWDGFLVVWYSVGIGGLIHGGEGAGFMWGMLLFPLLHVAAGVGLTYAVLCTFLNKTVIRVSSGELSVRHGPLPCTGNCNVFTAEIKQVFCTEKRTRGEDSIHRTYNVVALKHDDTKTDLITSLEDLDHAWFIEQQLEEHLKIADQRVPGEVRLNSAA